MNEAIKYAGLVGKYVRMSREWNKNLDMPEEAGGDIGGEGLVVRVSDNSVHSDAVDIMFDYGMGFTIFHRQTWTIIIEDYPWREELRKAGVRYP